MALRSVASVITPIICTGVPAASRSTTPWLSTQWIEPSAQMHPAFDVQLAGFEGALEGGQGPGPILRQHHLGEVGETPALAAAR